MKIRPIATMHRRDMNRVEERYAQHLRERLMVGEIRWWEYECWKFRLADNTWYTPDFVVVANDLRVEAHEVKTTWKGHGAGWQEDARVKIKVAADLYPVRFVAAVFQPDQSWQFEQFGEDREEPAPIEPWRKHVQNAVKLVNHFYGKASGQSAEELLLAMKRELEEALCG